ncbi:MAG: ATP-binding cassette domain-containing protein [Planctomycetota bacterium]
MDRTIQPNEPAEDVRSDLAGGGRGQPIVSVRDLHVRFGAKHEVRAVDGVSLDVGPGETLGLVGESGSGKTTVGRATLRLVPAYSGQVRFDGRDVLAASGRDLRALRSQMQIVFQDPAGSLNPRMRIRDIVAEPLRVHNTVSRDAILAEVESLLVRCGMPAAAAHRYPHEFSGGQRQRIGIARALAVRPRFIVCDEPTSALDVSIQSQIINLLKQLQRDLGLSYLFISHDMAVVRHMCSRIAVMTRGRIVETGERDQVLYDPQHDYTKRLLSAVPRIEAALA